MIKFVFSGTEPFEQIVDIPLKDGPNVKSGENWPNVFREEDVVRFHSFIHVYSPWARADKPPGIYGN